MSLKGLQKSLARIPFQLQRSIGHSPSSEDPVFDPLHSHLLSLETHTKSLYDAAKKLKQSTLSLSSHQSSLTQSYTNLLENNTALSDSLSAIHNNVIEEANSIERLVIAPLFDLVNIIDAIKKLITKRSHKLIDLQRHSESLAKLNEKHEKDPKKLSSLEQLRDTAQREFNNINNALINDLPILFSLKPEFFDPIILALSFFQNKTYSFSLSSFQSHTPSTYDTDILPLLDNLIIPKKHSPTSDTSKQSPIHSASPSEASNIQFHQPSTPNALPPIPVSSNEPALFAIALYDYVAQAEGDLSFSKNDKIQIVQKTDSTNDWWIGKINNSIGQFPANYVTLLE